MKILGKTKHHYDYWLLSIVGTLVIFGLIVLFSASSVESFQDFGNPSYYIQHQFFYGVLIGIVGLYVASKIDYHKWQKFLPIILFLAFGLLLLVKVPGLGVSSGGATRWVDFKFFSFQPAEFAKLALIIYLAGWTSSLHNKSADPVYRWAPAIFIIGAFSALILWQPDVGTMLSLIAVGAVMLFVGGMELKYLAGLGGLGFLMMLIVIKLEPYRLSRITTFLNPALDPKGIGYQINQALIAIGSGGIFGFGYGLSRQKHNYLPETIGDSIFAVIAEELGFVRVMFLVLLFLALILRGFKIAAAAPDQFGKMLGVGITSAIGLQALINMGAITGLLPLTGIPLPFFSYGSSALIINLTLVGILLNIARQTKT